MRLYFLRHGIAEEARLDLPDRARRLTPEGVQKMQAEAQGLKRLSLKLDRIITSPLPRARETAEIVAKALGLTDVLQVDERLAPGCRLGNLQTLVAEFPEAQRLMVVGHNPDLPLMAGRLAGGLQIELKKGGLLRVDTDRIEPDRGVLLWALPPEALTGAGNTGEG